MRSIITAALVSTCVTTAGVAKADFVELTSDSAHSTEGLGSFSAKLELVDSLLTLTLSNTSPTANGGYLTGFVFNGAGGATASLNLGLSSANVSKFVDLGPTEAANPFGHFEFGAALGGNWSGGGSPKKGIGDGETGTFVFNVGDTDTSSPLSVYDFVTDGGVGASNEHFGYGFLVRFRGFEDGGSDKVPGLFTKPPMDPPVAVPLPAGAWMGLATMAAIGGSSVVRRGRRMFA